MFWPKLENLLERIFQDINTFNKVDSPIEIFNKYKSEIEELSKEDKSSQFIKISKISDLTSLKAVEVARLLLLLKQRRQVRGAGKPLVGKMRAAVVPRQRPPFSEPVSSLSGELREIANIGQNKSYSLFQIEGWNRVLDTIRRQSGLVIVAPTGGGKSEVFMLPLIHEIACSVRSSDDSSNDPRFIFIYPRVELLKDQLERIFRYVYWAEKTIPPRPRNSKLKASRRHNRIIIGFQFRGIGRDNKTTLKDPTIFKEGYFEIVKLCPICSNGRLAPENKWHGVTPLRCENPSCDAEFSTTISRECHTEAKPHILVTTEESLSRLYLIPRRKYEEYLKSITGVVYDEAHLHYSLKGAHLYNLIDNIEKLKGKNNKQHLAKIASSATITNPGSFAAKLFYGSDKQLVPVHDATTFKNDPYGLEVIYFLQSPSDEGSPWPNSTMIQSVMALGHGLFIEQQEEHQERALLFTESIDITKRFQAQIHDAEKNTTLWKFRTDLDSLKKLGYMAERCPDTDPARCPHLYLKGECWRGIIGGENCTSRSLPLRLHHLTINMVSSKSRSDYWKGEVVVATSSLEVGVDDPRIKATFHYLPPRTVFSFIQRRGRAGRSQDDIAYSIMVLGNDPSSQFYLYRRHRLLSSGSYTLPLNAKNSVIADMHARLEKERARMGTFIARYETGTKSGAQEGILEWVYETLTGCPVINSLYEPKLAMIRSYSKADSQQRGLIQWVEEETRRLESFLNVKWTLEEIEDETPDALRANSQEIKELVRLFLNGEHTLESEIQTKILSLVDEFSALIISEQHSEVRDRLKALRLKLEQVWETIRFRKEKGYDPDLTLALYDFFRSFGSRFQESTHWLFNYEPDVIKTLLQAFFYLGIATRRRSDHKNGNCNSCTEHFVPDAFFQQVKPLVVELRSGNPRNDSNLVQESISDLASMFFPYKTIYRYFGERERDLSVIETDIVSDRVKVIDGNSVITVSLRGVGLRPSGLFVPQRVFVRPVRSDEEGNGIVKLCQICFKIFGLTNTGKCHNSELITVKLYSTPRIEREGSPVQDTTPERLSRNFEFMELVGFTKVCGADVTATKVTWLENEEGQGRYVLTRIKIPFRAEYDQPVAYRIQTRGIRWNLSKILNCLRKDSNLRQLLRDGFGKELTPSLVSHTAVHMLYKAISSISGVNEEVLEYAIAKDNKSVTVWERYEGGAGISEIIRDSLRTNPLEIYRELLASAVCPINLEENRNWTDIEELKQWLTDKWFLPTQDPFLSSVASEAEAEKRSPYKSERATEGHISCPDGCAVCLHVTYCTAPRDMQNIVTSRAVAEAIIRCMIKNVNTNQLNDYIDESLEMDIITPAILQIDPDKGESDVLLL